MNKKEILIEMLHGNASSLEELPDVVENISIFDSNGTVDGELLTEVLSATNRIQDVVTRIILSINLKLGADKKNPSKKAEDSGENWSVEKILKNCILDGNVVKLPKVRLNKNAYAEVKKYIEEAGGSWNGGKIQGFVFPFNPSRVFSILQSGKRINLKQEYQFFATPAEIADWLVSLAGNISADEKVLEPSAGTGAIIDAIHRVCPTVVVDCFELMPENKEILAKKENISIIGDDFTTSESGMYDKIIANPPFSNNQDVKHVRLMYEHLNEGGTIAAIMSNHWTNAKDKTSEQFREWLNEVGGSQYEIDSGSFKKSGTNVMTTAVVISKIKKTNF